MYNEERIRSTKELIEAVADARSLDQNALDVAISNLVDRVLALETELTKQEENDKNQ